MTDTLFFETETAIIDWMAQGCRPRSEWRIGTEHEKLGFDMRSYQPIAYGGERGIEAVLEGFTRFGWQEIRENGALIALERPAELGGGSVTLEPSGQLELSGAPLETLHQTCAEVSAHLNETREVSAELELGWLGIGYSPLWNYADASHMPKARYDIMRGYMPKRGVRGLDMMHLTCTVQVNLDFESEADMAEKMRIGMSLQPIATALFANSPFRDGKLSGCHSERACTWPNTDHDRTGILPFVFDADFGFARYVEYALDVPMYFIYRDGAYIDASGQSFRDFLRGELPARPGEKPQLADWETHLSTLFPEVRLKRFIEMRGADSGLKPNICALPAFWVGLLYDAQTQAKTAALIADWSAQDCIDLNARVPASGLATRFRGGTVLDIAAELVALSEEGLKARAKSDGLVNDERVFLAPLKEIVQSGRGFSDILRDKYHNEWNGDIMRVFSDMAF